MVKEMFSSLSSSQQPSGEVGQPINTQWSDDLSVGEPTLDHQHKEIFLLTKLVDRAVKEQGSVEKILEFLETYTQEHFKEEEDFMTAHDYEGLDEHLADHKYFTQKVVELRNTFSGISNGNSVKMIFPIRQLIDEIIRHIIQVDSKLKSIPHHGQSNSH